MCLLNDDAHRSIRGSARHLVVNLTVPLIMDIKVNIPALEKLMDYSASGIGSVAGSMLVSWKARQEAKAKAIAAKGEVEAQRIVTEGQADTMRIIATAQANARSLLVSPDSNVQGQLDFAHTVTQRIQFQEEKRQSNIEAVVRHAASELEDKHVKDHEPDHDWTARFFNDVQDVSTKETQRLYAKILAISEFPKWRKYLISLSFRDQSSVRPVQVGGFDVNIVIHRSTAVRGRGGPARHDAWPPSLGAILAHTDGPCGS